MNLFKTILIFNSASFLLAVCPSGFYEDDCGNCWLPYCYDYISHNMSYDSSEASVMIYRNVGYSWRTRRSFF